MVLFEMGPRGLIWAHIKKEGRSHMAQDYFEIPPQPVKVSEKSKKLEDFFKLILSGVAGLVLGPSEPSPGTLFVFVSRALRLFGFG